jgi:hypothetical protein
LATSTSNPVWLEKGTKSKALIVYNESFFLGFRFQAKNVVKTSILPSYHHTSHFLWRLPSMTPLPAP